jgi:carbamoyl-phosphate synthase large subunit
MRILLVNPGRKDYIINFFLNIKKKYNLQIYLIDADKFVPSFKVSNKTNNYISPKVNDKKKFKIFLRKFISEKKIDVVFPLSEWELELLAEEKNFYKKKNVEIVISNLKIMKICKNKVLMSKELLQNNFFSPEIIKFSEIHKKLPVIKKKISGSGSKSQSLIFEKWQIPKKLQKEFFFQKYLKDEEYGIDILNDLNGNYVHHCCRKKILIRSGDTDKAIIVQRKVFKDFAKKLSSFLKHVGIIDVDLIYKNNKIFILDINLRIGGGYPFTHLYGYDYIDKILSIIKNPNKKIMFSEKQKISGVVFTKGISIYKHK